jgi:hypothetical protein
VLTPAEQAAAAALAARKASDDPVILQIETAGTLISGGEGQYPNFKAAKDQTVVFRNVYTGMGVAHLFHWAILDDVLFCRQPVDVPPHWWHSRCGRDRDCIPDDRPNPFPLGWCNAMAWVAKGNGRFVEVWEPHNARKIFTVNAKVASPERVSRCAARAKYGKNEFVGRGVDDDRYTINVPGISDVLRIPGLDSKDLRRERYQRWQSSRSPLPEALRPLVKIITKLDDAQDLLFTALALVTPLLRRIGLRFIPFLGWALTLNDILNGLT